MSRSMTGSRKEESSFTEACFTERSANTWVGQYISAASCVSCLGVRTSPVTSVRFQILALSTSLML